MAVAPAPITMQPGKHTYDTFSDGSCPTGLECLLNVGDFYITKRIKANGYCASQRQWAIHSAEKEPLLFGNEDVDCGQKCCCSRGSYSIDFTNAQSQAVMNATRSTTCGTSSFMCACCDCCAFITTIEAPAGVVIGYGRQSHSCSAPHFEIQDVNFDTKLRIYNPNCCKKCLIGCKKCVDCEGCNCRDCCSTCCRPCCKQPDRAFDIYTGDMSMHVGTLVLKGKGMITRLTSSAFDADYEIHIPATIDVKLKAALFGVMNIIDLFYSKPSKPSKRSKK